MKDKLFDPARHNEKSPAPGMAAVNTHMPEETPEAEVQKENENENVADGAGEKGTAAPFGE